MNNIAKLVDVNSVRNLGAASDSMRRQFRDAGLLLSRQNIFLDPTIFRQQVAEVTYAGTGVSISNVGGLANTIDKIKTTPRGQFKSARDGDDTQGIISLSAERGKINVVQMDARSEAFTDDDLTRAAQNNIPLVTEYTGAMFSIFQQSNDGEFYSGETTGQKGLLNNALFASTNAAGLIDTLTGEEMYDILATLITDQWSGVFNAPAYMANVVVVPINVYNTIKRKKLNTAGGESRVSVLTALTDNFGQVKFVPTFRCGSGADSITCAFSNNMQSMVYRLPKPLTIHPQFKLSPTKYNIEADYRVAGLDIAESKSGRKLIGL